MFDLETYLRFAAALAAVLALILSLAWSERWRQAMAGVGGRPRRRLSVSETVPLDARTRLALVRCDAREYLLALGPNGVTRIAGPVSPPPALDVPPGTTDRHAR